MQRRDFLKIGTAGIVGTLGGVSGLIAWQPRVQAAVINKTLYITQGTIAQADGTNVYHRGFSSSSATLNVPGEYITVQEGDLVRITIVNMLSGDHSFVIDGVVNSGVISSGQTRLVEFTAGTPGSYLYYDGVSQPYNRLIGLHGALAIMPLGLSDQLYAGSPTFVQQYIWLFNDIDPAWNARMQQGLLPNTTYTPRYFTQNGLSSRGPGSAGSGDPTKDAMVDPRSALHGHVGDRALIRMLNAGMCSHSVHCHANHVEMLTRNGVIKADVWKKDCLYLDNNMGRIDAIFPFEAPPDAYPPVTTGEYPMHLHDEMSQTAGGGSYQFGAMTHITFE